MDCAWLLRPDFSVSLRWTRAEEFTWAYYRPAGVIDLEAALDSQNKIVAWHHVNINSGGNAMETPYRSGAARSQAVANGAPGFSSSPSIRS